MVARASRMRLPLLLGALLVAAVLVLTDKREPEVVGAVQRVDAPRRDDASAGRGGLPARGISMGEARSVVPPAILIPVLRERVRSTAEGNPFAVRDWNPQPPPAVVSTPKPVAPAFGYIVLGKQLVAGRWEVFLGQRERTLVVRAGDTIDGTFTVESIAPPVMTLAVERFTERQRIPIGDGQ